MRSVMRVAAAGVLAAALSGCAVYPGGGYGSVSVGTGYGYGGGYGGGYAPGYGRGFYGPPRAYYAPRPHFGHGGYGRGFGHGPYGPGGFGGWGRRW